MKKKNEPTLLQSLKAQADEIRKSWGKPVDERHYVVEVYPSRRYSYDNGHGGAEYDWTRERRARVSPFFKTAKDCEDWMELYEPDEGNSFEIVKQVLYERVVREWH